MELAVNIQLLLIVLCVAAAVAFMTRKVILTLARKAQCNCGHCSSSTCESRTKAEASSIKGIKAK